MSQPFSSKQNLKTDLLQTAILAALEWVANHRQTFYSIVLTMIVGVAVAAFMLVNFKNLNKTAWERYYMAQALAINNQADKSLGLYNEIISNYGRTSAAAYAMLGKGDLFFQQRNFEEAAKSYQDAQNKKPAKTILPLILSSLGAAHENMGKFPEAITAYKELIAQFPDHAYTPKAYESLARSYELTINPDAAKEIYEKMITMYPNTPWAEKARMRYQILAPQPFQNQNATPAAK